MTVDGSDVHRYAYDRKYQLTDANYPGGPEVDYVYDLLGNREQVVDGGSTAYTTNSLNQYTQVGANSDINSDLGGFFDSPTVPYFQNELPPIYLSVWKHIGLVRRCGESCEE